MAKLLVALFATLACASAAKFQTGLAPCRKYSIQPYRNVNDMTLVTKTLKTIKSPLQNCGSAI